jgi:calcineurin-like phosphoesterase family protein
MGKLMQLTFTKEEVAFTSDTHYGHANIIKYCSRPFPFYNTDEMDKAMLDGFMEMDAQGKTIFHMGDFVFNPKYLLATKWRPQEKHYIILGNHDKHADQYGKYRPLYREFFHYIIGTSQEWRKNKLQILVDKTQLVLTHEPLHNIAGNHYNIYGHHHNNMFTKPDFHMKDYGWLFGSAKHINVGVELTNYKPVTFDQLFTVPRA